MNEPTLEAYCTCLSVLQYVRAAHDETDYDTIVALCQMRCDELRREQERIAQEALRRQEEVQQRLERID